MGHPLARRAWPAALTLLAAGACSTSAPEPLPSPERSRLCAEQCAYACAPGDGGLIDGGLPAPSCVDECEQVKAPANPKCLDLLERAVACLAASGDRVCDRNAHACVVEQCAWLACDTCAGCDFTCTGSQCHGPGFELTCD